MIKTYSLILGVFCLLIVYPLDAREDIRIVGSAAVLPFAQTVSDNFSFHWDAPSPSLDITGTGQGFRLFCTGNGFEYPDVVITSRKISDVELQRCQTNGVREMTEIVVGKETLVVVNSSSAPRADFSIPHLFAGIADQVEVQGNIVKNPHQQWSSIDPSLPNTDIRVMGPPPTDPFHYAIREIVMNTGCDAFPLLKHLNDAQKAGACYSMRRDGAYRYGSKYVLDTLEWLRRHPEGFAIIPFPLLAQYPKITANAVNSVLPTIDNISSGRYPLSRNIRLYVKTKHVKAVKGLQPFLYEFTSERAISPNGYLVEKGFGPLDDIGRNHARDMAISLETIKLPTQ